MKNFLPDFVWASTSTFNPSMTALNHSHHSY